jgi:exosortase/archaeosortase family protein
VPADRAQSPTDAARFVVAGVATSLGLFGLLRLSWIEAHLVLPFTRAQADVAVRVFGTPTLPVEATLACSGADALALCLGAILAYPVMWRSRLAGAAMGTALILVLNTARIGTLGLSAASPALFSALHLYVWPAVLTLAIAGYVLAWMGLSDRRPRPAPSVNSVRALPSARPLPTRRFVLFAAVFLLLFLAASPFVLESTAMLALAGFMARASAALLTVAGATAHAVDNVLWTSRGGFLVTQECISTPLIPIYLAAICAWRTTWVRTMAGVIAAVPIFTALGIVRLLLVALPDAVMASPVLLAHAFFQLLLGAVVVFLAAAWRHGGRAAPGHALVGLVVGVLFVLLLGPFYARLVTAPISVPANDPQGALALLPAFQIAAFVAVGWPRFLAGLAMLGVTQTAGLMVLHAIASSGLTAQVRDVRGWAVAGPVLIFAVVVTVGRARR